VAVLILILGAGDGTHAVLLFELFFHAPSLILLFLDQEVYEGVILVAIAVIQDLLKPILSELLSQGFLVGTVDASPGFFGLEFEALSLFITFSKIIVAVI
jgi:hypothetical protein